MNWTDISTLKFEQLGGGIPFLHGGSHIDVRYCSLRLLGDFPSNDWGTETSGVIHYDLGTEPTL